MTDHSKVTDIQSAQTFSCPIQDRAKIGRDKCQAISGSAGRNQGCCAYRCESPWRICPKCILQQGGRFKLGPNDSILSLQAPRGESESQKVVRLAHGYCIFHDLAGKDADRANFVGKKWPNHWYEVLGKASSNGGSHPNTAPARNQASVARPAGSGGGGRVAVPPSMPPRSTPTSIPSPSRPPVPSSSSRQPVPSSSVSASAKSMGARVTDPISVKIGEVLDWPRARVRRMRPQPRKFFDPEGLDDLAESIREDGQLTPVPARRVFDDPDYDFELTDGERRWRALEIASIPTIKIVVGEEVSSARAYELGVIVNFNRADHTVLEQMNAVRILRDELGRSVAQIARKMGKSATHIYDLQDALNLPDPVKKLFELVQVRGKRGGVKYIQPLRFITALELKGLPPDQAIQYANHFVANKMSHAQATAYLRAAKNEPSKRPADDYNRLMGKLIDAERWLSDFLGKPAEFRRMFGRRSPETTESLARRVGVIREKLGSLEELIASAKDKQ